MARLRIAPMASPSAIRLLERCWRASSICRSSTTILFRLAGPALRRRCGPAVDTEAMAVHAAIVLGPGPRVADARDNVCVRSGCARSAARPPGCSSGWRNPAIEKVVPLCPLDVDAALGEGPGIGRWNPLFCTKGLAAPGPHLTSSRHGLKERGVRKLGWVWSSTKAGPGAVNGAGRGSSVEASWPYAAQRRCAFCSLPVGASRRSGAGEGTPGAARRVARLHPRCSHELDRRRFGSRLSASMRQRSPQPCPQPPSSVFSR